MALFGCNTTENTNDDITKEKEEEKKAQDNNENESNSKGEAGDNESNIVLNIGSIETVNRIIEGMDEEVKVVNYQIQPYDISYQLDETIGISEVKDNQITYLTQNDAYKIILESIEHTNREKAVANLQEKFETEEYEEKGELESTPSEENDLKGKMQFFGYPVKGFYVYEIDEHVLVITYQYPEEGGDGMYPLLESLRKSINVQ